MAPMHAMKSSPLVRSQWTQEGVIHEFHITPKVLFAGSNAFVHSGNISCQVRYHFFRCQPLGACPDRSFLTTGQVAKARDQESSQAILWRCRSGRGLSSLSATLEDDSCSTVGERKVLQNLGYTPLPFRVPCQLLGRDAGALVCNQVCQLL